MWFELSINSDDDWYVGKYRQYYFKEESKEKARLKTLKILTELKDYQDQKDKKYNKCNKSDARMFLDSALANLDESSVEDFDCNGGFVYSAGNWEMEVYYVNIEINNGEIIVSNPE